MNDLKAGVTIDEIVFNDTDFFTFAFSIDQTLVPEMAATGEGVGVEFFTGSTAITLSGTAVPEPSTYAAIFGVLQSTAVASNRAFQLVDKEATETNSRCLFLCNWVLA